MILISVLFIRVFVWSNETPSPIKNVSAWCFFLQGAGFMLIETNTITRMALILGSTWVVTSVAVMLVLLAALVANFIIQRFAFPSVSVAIGLVAITTLLNYIAGPHLFLLYLPILASSLVFGRLFQRSEKSSYDLGMNILGAMVGGMLEYSSLIIGTKAVYLLAFVVFLTIVPFWRRHEI